MFPIALLMAKISADGSISLVMMIMLPWASASTDGNSKGTMLSINMKAIMASTDITRLADDNIVFARLKASFLSLFRYSEKTGMNAATNAPAINILKSMSGIKNEAL